MRELALQSAIAIDGGIGIGILANPRQSVSTLIIDSVSVQSVDQVFIIVGIDHVDVTVVRIVRIITKAAIAILDAVEGAILCNGSRLNLLTVEVVQVSLNNELAVLMRAIDTIHDNIGSSSGVVDTADDVAIGIEVEREGLAIVSKLHSVVLAQNKAASGRVLGTVDRNGLGVRQIGSAGQLASLGVSSSDASHNTISLVIGQVLSLALLQRESNQNLGANSVVGGSDTILCNEGLLRIDRLVILHINPNLQIGGFAIDVVVLVGLVDLGDFREEGVDSSDNPAIFGLEDLRQVTLAAELSIPPAAGNLLAVLGLIMSQNNVADPFIAISILTAINCEIVQSGISNSFALDSQLGSLGGCLGRAFGDALAVAVQMDFSARGLGNLHVVLQDVAHGNSSGVAVDRSIHVERGPGTVAPSIARTAEVVSCTGDGDAHLGAEGVAGSGNLLVGNEGIAVGIIPVVQARVGGLVVVADNAVLDLLAVLNQILGQSVVQDLRSFATGDGGDGLPAVSQTSGQANFVGAVQDVDVPAGAGVAFLGGVEVQGGEHQLQELNAGHVAVRLIGGGGHAISQAGDAAVVDEGQSPAVVAVHERVLCIAVQTGDRVLVFDCTVGSRVVDDRHDLGRLGTGEGVLSLEGIVVAILKAIEDLQAGQSVDSIGIVVGSLDVCVGLCASDGDDAHDHDDGQDQRKNLLQILHLDFLLFKFYTSGRGPLCNLYLHFTAREAGSQEGGGVCNLIVTLGG